VKLILALLISAAVLLLVPSIAEAKIFKAENYTVTYPNGCHIDKKENRFSSSSRIECKGDAGFQFETIDQADIMLYGILQGGDINGTIMGDSNALIDTMLTLEDKMWENVREVERGVNKYTINGQPAPHLLIAYDQPFNNLFGAETTKDFAALVVAIKIGEQYLIATYDNNENNFDNFLPQAEKIIQSVRPVGAHLGELDNRTMVTETDNLFTDESNDPSRTSALCDTVTTQSAKDLCGELLN
jgi:hypothetical protein